MSEDYVRLNTDAPERVYLRDVELDPDAQPPEPRAEDVRPFEDAVRYLGRQVAAVLDAQWPTRDTRRDYALCGWAPGT